MSSFRRALQLFKATSTEENVFPGGARALFGFIRHRRRHWLLFWLERQITHALANPSRINAFATCNPTQEIEMRRFCNRHQLNYDGLKCYLANVYAARTARTSVMRKMEARWFRKERLFGLDAPLFYAVQFYAYLKTGAWQPIIAEESPSVEISSDEEETNWDVSDLFDFDFATLFKQPMNTPPV